MKAIQGQPQAVLMVEFSGDDAGARSPIASNNCSDGLHGVNGLTASVPALDPALRDPLWDLRRAAMPLLYGMPGDRKPVTFVEDTAVAPARSAGVRRPLPRPAAQPRHRRGVLRPCQRRLSAHSAGAEPQGRRRRGPHAPHHRGGHRPGAGVRRLAQRRARRRPGPQRVEREDVRPRRLRGVSPGQAGLRSAQLLNPGKVVDAPADDGEPALRPDYQPVEPPTVFDYSRQEGFVRSIEMCNGSGVCRKMQGGTMCPSFRATRDEKDSTRGRANALRLALAGGSNSRAAPTSQSRRESSRRARSVPDVQGVQGGVSQQRRSGQAQGGVSAILLSRTGHGRLAIGSWPTSTG